MNAIFKDLQEQDCPFNGTCLRTAPEFTALLRSLKGRKPFMFVLSGDNGFVLTIGLAKDCASVQYSSSHGLPPYLEAVNDNVVEEAECVEFLAGGTPTPIPRRFCLPIEQVERIASDFIVNGCRSEAVRWEEI